MSLENEQGNLLAQSITMADKIADSHGPNDRFILLTNDLKAEHQRLLSADEFKEAVTARCQNFDLSAEWATATKLEHLLSASGFQSPNTRGPFNLHHNMNPG